jgi:predicted dehydrogenase
MYLDEEHRDVGKRNYNDVMNAVSRRDFLKAGALATAVPALTLGAMYFGYDKVGEPLRVGVIGTGDEGQVLLGACNPDYVQIVALADLRPSAIRRAFYGDFKGSAVPVPPRPGILKVYGKQHGWKTMEEAQSKQIKVYKDYKELLKNDEVEAVIIALPLHLHSKVAIEAMEAGKHVLTEKLMAQTVQQCKDMTNTAESTDKILAVDHQRHYNVLYENAVHLIQNTFLGELHSIRAQWHRNNLPGADSWSVPLPGGETTFEGKLFDRIAKERDSLKKKLDTEKKNVEAGKRVDPVYLHNLEMTYEQWKLVAEEAKLDAEKYDYKGFQLGDTRKVGGLEELVRWRLWDRTGGGIMAELGSHQLDAASIFISALKNRGKPRHQWDMVHPLTVHTVGGRHVFPHDRDIGDHVYCLLEFPAPGYWVEGKEGIEVADPKKKITYQYSTINGNGFGGYGEVVFGTKGTFIITREEEATIMRDESASKVSVGKTASLDTQAAVSHPQQS